MAFGCQMRITLDDERVIELKPFTREHMPQVVDGMQRYSNLKWLATDSAKTLEMEQAWYDHISTSNDDVIFGVFQDDRLVGSFGLHRIASRRAGAGAVMFSLDHQSQGIGTYVTRAGLYYAVTVLDIMAIDSGVLASNERSQRMQESAGFVVTGRKIHTYVVDGRPTDELMLLWVNPAEHAWNYFWRDALVTQEFLDARERARVALAWAQDHVKFP